MKSQLKDISQKSIISREPALMIGISVLRLQYKSQKLEDVRCIMSEGHGQEHRGHDEWEQVPV